MGRNVEYQQDFVSLTLPQVADSNNNVFGRTLVSRSSQPPPIHALMSFKNPHKLCCTAGGSSGGEGALVAMRGSLIGVGTDIAGSIRVPALCCGLYGFKPSSRRVAYGLQADAVREGDPLMEIIPPVAGPLCHSMRDARLFLETVIQEKYFEFDFTSIAVPWRPTAHKSKLIIGVVSEAPDHPVSPPIKRAVRTAAEKLQAAGHTVVQLENLPSFSGAEELSMKSFAFDNDNLAFQWVSDSGEPFVKAVVDCYAPENMPKGTRTLNDLFPDSIERDEYKKAWHDIFRDHKLDIVIAPGNNTPAPPHDTYGQFTYTLMWNLLQVSHDAIEKSSCYGN
jgi:amidase